MTDYFISAERPGAWCRVPRGTRKKRKRSVASLLTKSHYARRKEVGMRWGMGEIPRHWGGRTHFLVDHATKKSDKKGLTEKSG